MFAQFGRAQIKLKRGKRNTTERFTCFGHLSCEVELNASLSPVSSGRKTAGDISRICCQSCNLRGEAHRTHTGSAVHCRCGIAKRNSKMTVLAKIPEAMTLGCKRSVSNVPLEGRAVKPRSLARFWRGAFEAFE